MKIDKLYTLSQFVDWIDETNSIEYWKKLGLIFRYNKFLKQPLKKEMFVFIQPFELGLNHKENPEAWSPDEIEAWQEAEKKVIFKGHKKSDSRLIEYMLLTDETLMNLANNNNKDSIELKNVEI